MLCLPLNTSHLEVPSVDAGAHVVAASSGSEYQASGHSEGLELKNYGVGPRSLPKLCF